MDYAAGVFGVLFKYKKMYSDLIIIEGCCEGSADQWAEKFAENNNIPIEHHPGEEKTYLKRNLEMVEACDEVLAFFDGYSYGTAFTISNALMQGKKVIVIKI